MGCRGAGPQPSMPPRPGNLLGKETESVDSALRVPAFSSAPQTRQAQPPSFSGSFHNNTAEEPEYYRRMRLLPALSTGPGVKERPAPPPPVATLSLPDLTIQTCLSLSFWGCQNPGFQPKLLVSMVKAWRKVLFGVSHWHKLPRREKLLE